MNGILVSGAGERVVGDNGGIGMFRASGIIGLNSKTGFVTLWVTACQLFELTICISPSKCCGFRKLSTIEIWPMAYLGVSFHFFGF